MQPQHLQELARSRAREILSQSASFHQMPVADQKAMYHQLVREQTQQLSDDDGVSTAMARRRKRKDKASDLINDRRHDDVLDFSNAGEALTDVMEAVNFPEFVKDLLKAVFDGNMAVMKEQTDNYIKLMKEATKSVASFIKDIDDTTAFGYLAENSPNDFNISMEEDPEGGEKMTLTDPRGDKVDLGDNQVKAKIMEAKIKMAQEHRAALRETLLMGVTRLVVEKGQIEAEVLFDFKGKRKLDKADKAMLQTKKSSGNSVRGGTGLISSLFGGVKGGRTSSKRQTQLSVSSAKSSAEDNLQTKLRGFVKIDFKTDYFKLDNFAEMYAPPTKEEQQAALPSGG